MGDAAMAVGGADAPDRELLVELLGTVNVQKCFVQLLDWSRDSFNEEKPGLDAGSARFFMIYEIGQESLGDKLTRHRDEGQPLKVEELRSLQWSFVSIACALHAVGFVHLDIKPANVVCFNGVWKLIDLDSAMHAHDEYDMKQLTTTASYLSPELAMAILDPKLKKAKVSRLSDVWSVGMC